MKMKVLLVSECSKNALTETRRILDQFAERKGGSCWATEITDQGLQTLKKLLRSTARKNTAVSCLKIGGTQGFELLWIVGDRTKFSSQGSVPTNRTTGDILKSELENDWDFLEGLKILVQIAALFHDFGKASKLFQEKLKKRAEKKYEPYRHEWVSAFVFTHFVGDKEDKDWFKKLSDFSKKDRDFLKDEEDLLSELAKNSHLRKVNPFFKIPHSPLARFILWLILSHHRLPEPPADRAIEKPSECIFRKTFDASWNSIKHDKKEEFTDYPEILERNFFFEKGTPFRSQKWVEKAGSIGEKAFLFDFSKNEWLHDRFSLQVGRMVLMLADHIYSAGEPTSAYQDIKYDVYANTCRESNKLKQKLDEHNIGVCRKSKQILRKLPLLRSSLPSLKNVKTFKTRSADPKYQWQDKAYDLAVSLAQASERGGFFGVNIASTGCGKTLGNTKIIYGLNSDSDGCRFNIALGLRTLTLQTGDAIKEMLKLSDEDLAVVIGSDAHKKLHELNQDKSKQDQPKKFPDYEDRGSESEQEIFPDEEIRFEPGAENEILTDWFGSSPKKAGYLSAPVLVSTIDQLINATEGHRGGKQIAPILRLLTSDLILDEPDDFNVEDLHALCRLVNYAGLFGSKVLLSSATLTPTIVESLFKSYQAGRKAYNHARKRGVQYPVACAWFDEKSCIAREHSEFEDFKKSHEEFIVKRVERIEEQPPLRKGKLIHLGDSESDEQKATIKFSDTIRDSIYNLHQLHSIANDSSGIKISVGLVRMANIDPLVMVAKELLSKSSKEDYSLHFCVYHSRFPLIIRSEIEKILDKILVRHNPSLIWDLSEVQEALKKKDSAKNHIFIVLATSVAEVGRDHDYDWAIVEPSSMRSIIQLAGRVQRHRKVPPKEPNIHILEKNIRALKSENIPYSKPGFEKKETSMKLEECSLFKILKESTYNVINAIPRLVKSTEQPTKDLVDLEHYRLESELEKSSEWNKGWSDCTAYFQNRFEFRADETKKANYFYWYEDEGESPKIYEREDKRVLSQDDRFERDNFKPAEGCFYLGDLDLDKAIKELNKSLDHNLNFTAEKYSCVTLNTYDFKWSTHLRLGFYRNKFKNNK